MLLEGHPCGVLILSTVQISVTVLDSFVTKFLQKIRKYNVVQNLLEYLGGLSLHFNVLLHRIIDGSRFPFFFNLHCNKHRRAS